MILLSFTKIILYMEKKYRHFWLLFLYKKINLNVQIQEKYRAHLPFLKNIVNSKSKSKCSVLSFYKESRIGDLKNVKYEQLLHVSIFILQTFSFMEAGPWLLKFINGNLVNKSEILDPVSASYTSSSSNSIMFVLNNLRMTLKSG